MTCPCCEESYSIRKEFWAKRCLCDDEERFVPFSSWYFLLFGVNTDIIEML